MRSNSTAMSNGLRHVVTTGAGLAILMLITACSQIPDQWREDGPSVDAEWRSPSAVDILENHEPSPTKPRDHDEMVLVTEPYGVSHWPLYFEDPFVDKGHGREGRNKYHIGWEDYVAMPYSYSRFTLNWLFVPVSAVVTPPWTLMTSDGEISEQLLGPDHDATKTQ